MTSKWTKDVMPGGRTTAGLDRDVRDGLERAKAAASAGPKGDTGQGSPPGGPSKPGETIFSKPAPEAAAKKMSEVLGEIVWLMSQSPLHKQFFIADLEWFVMTPLLLQQFRLFYAKDRPMGVAFWGFVSEEVEERLKTGTSRLRPQDWKSGDRLWVVEVVAPFGGVEEMVKDLKAKVFKDREVKFLGLTSDGHKQVLAM
jgi:cytolysin-activating lysine-acyltransferase